MHRRRFIEKTIGGTAIVVSTLYSSPLPAFNTNVKEFVLPKLSYEYSALEPYIDKLTMEIHHTKHHETYVKNLNKEVASNTTLSGLTVEEILKSVSKFNTAVRNNAGGHYNHSLFWQLLSPAKTQPSTDLNKAIASQFGSFDKFKEGFTTAATAKFGSGWIWLMKDKSTGKLKITSTSNQDNPLMDVSEEKGFPILGLDIWEHAYYLKYQNKRAEYISAFWNVINWDEVNKLFKNN